MQSKIANVKILTKRNVKEAGRNENTESGNVSANAKVVRKRKRKTVDKSKDDEQMNLENAENLKPTKKQRRWTHDETLIVFNYLRETILMNMEIEVNKVTNE